MVNEEEMNIENFSVLTYMVGDTIKRLGSG